MARQSAKLVRANTQYFEIPAADQTGLDLTTKFTFFAQVKMSNLSVTQEFFARWDGPAGERSFFIRLDSVGRVRFFFSEDGSATLSNYTFFNAFNAVMDIDQWVSFGISIDTTTDTAILRRVGDTKTGVKTGTGSQVFVSQAPFTVGSRAGSFPIDGQIAHARVWNTNLSEAEIDLEASSPTPVRTANLQLDVPFNGNANDTSPNGNDLTPINSPTYVNDSPFPSNPNNLFGLGL